MKKVLFIAYQFPPRGGPGVHRSLNFVKYLREYGYDPIVLTIDEADIIKAGHPLDSSLSGQLPPDLIIIRTPSREPVRLIRFLMRLHVYRLFWFLFYPYFWEWSARWPRKTFRTAEALVKEHGISLVYTSSSPYSSLLLGKLLKQRLGVKWVADLRDPFTDAYFWSFPSKIHWLFARRFERKILSIPDRVIVNTPEVKKMYIRRRLVKEEKLTWLSNGF